MPQHQDTSNVQKMHTANINGFDVEVYNNQERMKTFIDLEFSKPNDLGLSKAKLQFNADYAISVVLGGYAQSNGIDTYEVVILYKGGISYNNGIANDVLGWQTRDKVSSTMERLQELIKQEKV